MALLPGKGGDVLACAVLAASVAAYHHEIVFGGRTFLPIGSVVGVMGEGVPFEFAGEIPRDAYHVDSGAGAWVVHAQSREVARAFRERRLPLWNPHQGFGAPLAANAQSGAFDVLRLPVFLSSRPGVWDAYFLLRTGAGLLVTYFFARSLGLGHAGALVAALGFGYCGFLVLFENTHFPEIYLLLPAVLWATDVVRGPRRRRGLVALSLSVAATILAGMPEASLMVLVLGAAYGAYRMAWDAVDARSWRAAVSPRNRLLVLGWVIGIGLAAVLILPLAEYIAHAFHVHGPERRVGLRADRLSNLVLLAVPFLHGLPYRWLLPSEPAIVWAGFSGATIVVLAVAGALAWRGGPERRAQAFFVGALVVLWAKFYGAPVINELGRLPPLNMTLIAKWGAPLVSFLLALLAGFAVDAACAARGLRPRVVAATALVVVAFAGLMVRLNERFLPLFGPEHLQATLVPALAAAAFACAALLAPLSAPARGAVLCAAVFAELYRHGPDAVYPTRHDPLRRPPYVDYLQERQRREPPFRVLGLQGILYPNYATAYHLDDIRMLDALYPDRYMEYLRAFIAEGVHDRYTGGYGSREKPTRLAANKWLDAANVRFVIVPGGSPAPGKGDPAAAGQWVRVYRHEFDIYENRHALPRAFVAEEAVVVRDRARAREKLLAPGFEPSRTVVLEDPSGTLRPPPPAPESAAAARLKVTLYDEQQVEVRVKMEKPGVLVLADAYFPGWKAEVDGQPAPIYAADIAFRGVVLPGGVHHVVFRYRPASAALGFAIAAASLGGLALAVARLREEPPA